MTRIPLLRLMMFMMISFREISFIECYCWQRHRNPFNGIPSAQKLSETEVRIDWEAVFPGRPSCFEVDFLIKSYPKGKPRDYKLSSRTLKGARSAILNVDAGTNYMFQVIAREVQGDRIDYQYAPIVRYMANPSGGRSQQPDYSIPQRSAEYHARYENRNRNRNITKQRTTRAPRTYATAATQAQFTRRSFWIATEKPSNEQGGHQVFNERIFNEHIVDREDEYLKKKSRKNRVKSRVKPSTTTKTTTTTTPTTTTIQTTPPEALYNERPVDKRNLGYFDEVIGHENKPIDEDVGNYYDEYYDYAIVGGIDEEHSESLSPKFPQSQPEPIVDLPNWYTNVPQCIPAVRSFEVESAEEESVIVKFIRFMNKESLDGLNKFIESGKECNENNVGRKKAGHLLNCGGKQACCPSPWHCSSHSQTGKEACITDYIHCDGGCLPTEWVGDGWPDCLDGTDESNTSGAVNPRDLQCVACGGPVLTAGYICREQGLEDGRKLSSCVQKVLGEEGNCNQCINDYIDP